VTCVAPANYARAYNPASRVPYTRLRIVLERPFANTETLRLADIHSLAIFYTPLDARFDRLTRLAQKALNVPVAAIALHHLGKLWFKSVQGWNIHDWSCSTFCAAHHQRRTRSSRIRA
jgi:hypothetical protein